jgi:hypothetical protein
MSDRIPAALQARIDKIGKISSLKHVQHVRHQETGRFEMTGINCKICGSVIAGPVDSGMHSKTERIGQREIIYRTLLFSRYSQYTEIEIEFNDGSHHVTHLCKQCIPRVTEPGMLERLYVADLAQFIHEDLVGVHQNIWDGLDMMITRQPTGKWTDLGGV